ncbi:hypothetical protein B0H17DRAFT_1152408 [Mycena rosella]|uniref:Uncharacterized protein n=1 Tax=Mycena rosella TaxID=1033263 RepID=A0AAD7BDY4_MYCRO|nr:hypothetical protein B0H17DRAFT_1152408 [Mycena rosella]
MAKAKTKGTNKAPCSALKAAHSRSRLDRVQYQVPHHVEPHRAHVRAKSVPTAHAAQAHPPRSPPPSRIEPAVCAALRRASLGPVQLCGGFRTMALQNSSFLAQPQTAG